MASSKNKVMHPVNRDTSKGVCDDTKKGMIHGPTPSLDNFNPSSRGKVKSK